MAPEVIHYSTTCHILLKTPERGEREWSEVIVLNILYIYMIDISDITVFNNVPDKSRGALKTISKADHVFHI